MSNSNMVMGQAAAGNHPQLSRPWDLSFAYYDDPSQYNPLSFDDSGSRSVSFEEIAPTGVYVSPDGTKMYVCGSSGDDVNQYDLSTPFLLSSETFVRNFSVSAQDTNPQDVFFKPDGIKMYIIGSTNASVYEYDLSTAWDISTASFSTSFSVSAQDTSPTSLSFSPDGTKMYIVGTQVDDLMEYDLSTAWDISTASFLQTSFAPSGTPQGVEISSDGRSALILNSNTVTVYSLPTPFDSSVKLVRGNYTLAGTAAASGIRVSNGFMYATDTTNDSVYRYIMGGRAHWSPVGGLYFKPDGSRVFTLDVLDGVVEGAVGTGFPVIDQIGPGGIVTGVTFKTDGTSVYLATNSNVYQYDLGSAWDTGTMSYVQSFNVSSQDTNTQAVSFKADGTKMYTIGFTNDSVYEYDLSTAWDISTAVYLQSFSVAAQETAPSGLFFKPDGTKMYVVGSSGDAVREYDLSVAWDVSSASYLRAFSVATQETVPRDLAFNSDGTKMYIVGDTVDAIRQYNLSTAWNIASASYVGFDSFSIDDLNPQGIALSSDDTKLYAVGFFNDRTKNFINEYDLPTAGDVSDARFRPVTDFWNLEYVRQNQVFSGVGEDTTTDLFFKPDGTKMYVVGTTGDAVREFSLSVAWDIGTATFTQSFSVAAQETTPSGLFFKPDGTKMYVCGTVGDDVNEYNLSTAWDVSTASYVQNFSVATELSTPQCVAFKDDGTKMYVGGGGAIAGMLEYNLSTPWDVSSATYSTIFSTPLGIPNGVAFKDDGTKMYCINSNFRIFTYTLGVQP